MLAPNIFVLLRRSSPLDLTCWACAECEGARDRSLRPRATSRIDFIRPRPVDFPICLCATLVTVPRSFAFNVDSSEPRVSESFFVNSKGRPSVPYVTLLLIDVGMPSNIFSTSEGVGVEEVESCLSSRYGLSRSTPGKNSSRWFTTFSTSGRFAQMSLIKESLRPILSSGDMAEPLKLALPSENVRSRAEASPMDPLSSALRAWPAETAPDELGDLKVTALWLCA